MRPVNKGHKEKEYNPYGTARRDLFEAIGSYCSYCERNIHIGSEIEHVQPKSKVPEKEYSWDNFLLGCKNCNSTKNNKTVDDDNLNDFVWPDIDDTYHMVQYDPVTLMPSPAPYLSNSDKARVNRLISLVGLDKIMPKEDTQDYEEARDTRVEDRIQSAIEARHYKQEYLDLPPDMQPIYLSILMDMIKKSNNWSIWMREMEDIPELRAALLDLLPGTRKEFFE